MRKVSVLSTTMPTSQIWMTISLLCLQLMRWDVTLDHWFQYFSSTYFQMQGPDSLLVWWKYLIKLLMTKDHEDGENIQKESISSTAPFNVVTLHTSRMPGTRKVIPIRTMRNYFINVPLITKNTDNQLLQKELTSMKSQKYWAIRGPLCTISCKQEPALCQTYWRKANIHINYYLKKQKFIFDNL